jgi:hypothetical protein
MNEKMEHFDEKPEMRVSSKLSADLNVLFEAKRPVPPEVDRAISDRIRRHFAFEKPAKDNRRRFRWAGLWKVAAAAAVVLLAFSLDLTHKSPPTIKRSVRAGVRPADIDLNGRVDILDAFKLARQIKDADLVEPDLSLQEHEWDMNGDGRVDHSDVDIVALAAVRLDKGVL